MPESVGAEEYAVYRDLLLANEEMWNIPTGTENVVFFDHTFVRGDPDRIKATFKGKAGVSEELVANFLAANSRSYPLEARFELGKPVTLVPEEAIRNLIRGLQYAVQCYQTVRAVYPAPEYNGWYYLSRVGFDARMETALVYIEQTLCGGSGDFLVLEKQAGVWKIVGWEMGIRSDMGLDSPVAISDEEYAVYDALLNASKEFALGTGYRYLTVYDQTGLSEELTREGADPYLAISAEIPAVTEELVDNLGAANAEPYDVAPAFAFEVPVALVSWREYEALSAELEGQECLAAARERFPYPQFQGWFRLSRVGFSQSMDQALVYVESYLCSGAGFVVLLEKHDDRWGMAAYTPFPADMPPTTSQPTSDLGAALTVMPALQAVPAGSSAKFELAIVPSCPTHPSAFGVDQLPAGWTAEFLASAIPCNRTLVLTTAETAQPGRYSIRVTAASETDLSTWAELTVEILPCVEFQPGEFTRAMGSNPVTLITAGKPAIEHGLLIPLQVCDGQPGRRLLVTLEEVNSEAGSRMTAPSRFYLYRSRVWPEPNSIVAHGVPGTINVELPRIENRGWQLEANITPGLYLLVFERDHYGSSPDRQAIPASLTYRLEISPQGGGGETSTPPVSIHPGWASYTNGNLVKDLAFDANGALWAVGSGGAVRWDLERGTYTKYTVDDGLASNDVLAIAVAPDGAAWFSTDGSGVSRFDGKEWTTYTHVDGMASDFVYASTVTPDGQLWFGTHTNGVSRFGGKAWTTYTTTDGLADNWVDAVAVAPDGVMWFGTAGGVSRFDGKAWTTYTEADGLARGLVLDIAIAPDGVLWFGTYGGGASRFDGKAWKTYATADGLVDDDVLAVAVTPDGAVWFGTPVGVSRFDGEAWTTYTEADGLAAGWVRAIAVAPDAAVWFGTWGGGVSRFDGKAWTTYRTSHELASNRVYALGVAPDGTVWFGTSEWPYALGGASRFDGQTWTTYRTGDGLAADEVHAVAVAPDGAVWFGTANGVSRFDGEFWTTYTTTDGLADRDVSALAVAPDGSLWFGTRTQAYTPGGASRFDGKTWSTYRVADGLADNNLFAIAVASDGAVWFGGYSTSRFDGKAWRTYTAADGLAAGAVLAIAVAPDGAMWFGTATGVSRFDGEDWTTYTRADGLASDKVLAIAVAPDGALWFGTTHGASRFDGKDWTTYATADGLASDVIQAIAAAPDGALWFGTDAGVSRYVPVDGE